MDAAPRMLAFSPAGVDACFNQIYLHALNLANGIVGRAQPPTPAETKRLRLANKLPPGVIVAAAGDGRDVATLQSVLDRAGVNVHIPVNLAHDAVVGVSSVVYAFKWPSEMIWHGNVPPGAFCLKGVENQSFVARVYRTEYDAAVAYVERAEDYDISVAMMGMPDQLPAPLLDARDNDDLMDALTDMHRDIVSTRGAQPSPLPPLGKVTLCTVDDASTFKLRSVVGRALPGGRSVDEAMHACRLFMNKDGGGVRAGTVMISKGFRMDLQPPVDIDFRAFRNGYLVAIEMTRCNVADFAPVALVLAWINVPAGIASQ